MLDGHSSPRTSLPLAMRAVFEVSGETDETGNLCIKKIKRVCLPFESNKWKELNFETSKSIYENAHTIDSYIYPIFYSHRINLTVSVKNN
ncbi:hypothetical protein BN1013_02130 [Candidatus Rubidus massiliensis]|nr:hypothetical protein BN1013_02130 [Candidatus Rubidus massiliensis]